MSVQIKSLEKAIEGGLRKGYFESGVLKTSTNSFNPKVIEYLLTVNIVQSLLEWNREQNYQYSIYLEHDVNEFLEQAFQTEMEFASLFESSIKLADKMTLQINDSGRLDIAITTKDNKSYAPIEVKSVNKNYSAIVEDIIRIAELVGKQDPAVDNSIEVGFGVFLKYIGGTERISKEETLNNTRKRISEQIIEKCEPVADKFNVNISPRAIVFHQTSASDIRGSYYEDYSEVAADTGCVFAVITKITRK